MSLRASFILIDASNLILWGRRRVSIVKPQLTRVRLYSQALKKFVPLTMTPEMIRRVEAEGGLDAFLTKVGYNRAPRGCSSQGRTEDELAWKAADSVHSLSRPASFPALLVIMLCPHLTCASFPVFPRFSRRTGS